MQCTSDCTVLSTSLVSWRFSLNFSGSMVTSVTAQDINLCLLSLNVTRGVPWFRTRRCYFKALFFSTATRVGRCAMFEDFYHSFFRKLIYLTMRIWCVAFMWLIQTELQSIVCRHFRGESMLQFSFWTFYLLLNGVFILNFTRLAIVCLEFITDGCAYAWVR